jgi:hypothetical protein
VKSREESAYVDAWLKSRQEQEDLRAKKSLDWLDKELLDCRKREVGERVVSENVRAYLRSTAEVSTSPIFTNRLSKWILG